MLDRSDMYPYQERIVQHIKDVDNNAAWVDMGLGKTVSTLTAIQELRESFDVDKTLIVAPLRVARKTWDDEMNEWAHLKGSMKIAHIIGTEKQRLAGLEEKADIHMINREQVQWLKGQFVKGTGKKMKLKRRWPWDHVVIDESSSFKSASSNRFKALRALRPCYARMTQLTGTPAPNGYQDLWAQMNLLDRGKRLGYNIGAFRARWMNAPDRWDPASSKYTMKEFSRAQIEAAVRDLVISLKAEDYLDLPEIQYNPVPVYLDAKQLDKYRVMQRRFVFETLEGKRITAVNAGVLTGKLLQLANGTIYTGERKQYEIFHDQKIRELMEVLDQSYGPVMVTAWFQSDMERVRNAVAAWCKANKKSWNVLTDKASEDDWNEGRTDVLIIHPASAGHGLNLHKNDCECIIWFGLTWSLELYEQLNARIAGGHRRIGKNIIIHHILSQGTIDDRVFQVLNEKGMDQAGLVAAVKVIAEEILGSG